MNILKTTLLVTTLVLTGLSIEVTTDPTFPFKICTTQAEARRIRYTDRCGRTIGYAEETQTYGERISEIQNMHR